ncbi:MAG: hypothetical protein GPJ54_21500 [Candidatus Heimdallarchaeota archaeon]|nr:hypothetical protein [Candidatus Heimdallarchaeota archaeon]
MVVKIDRVRYMKVAFFSSPPSLGQFIGLLRRLVSDLAGEIFLSSSAVHVVEFTEKSAIIKCTNHSRDVVESAIQLIQFNDFVPVITRISGTLKALSKTAIDNSDNED